MNSAAAHWTVMVPHPGTAREPVAGIAVEVRRPNPATLVCNYSLHGQVGRLQMSGGGAGHRRAGLWEHTCFEAFIAAAGAPDYYEFNFSPTLAWAAYYFTGYRAGMTPANLSQAPGVQVRRAADRLELAATVHLAGLPLVDAPVLRLALAAVVEDYQGRVSYWALEHPPGKADFHHADGYTIELRSA